LAFVLPVWVLEEEYSRFSGPWTARLWVETAAPIGQSP
jgi:hypothetical protein